MNERDLRALDRQLRQRDGLERERAIRAVSSPIFEDSPAPSHERLGGALHVDAGVWLLEGRPLTEGDEVELYTNAATGWVRGRFSLDGDAPRLGVPLWDVNGPWDDQGQAPWVGVAQIPLPARAVLRWRPGRR
jgi:hypothetical protein